MFKALKCSTILFMPCAPMLIPFSLSETIIAVTYTLSSRIVNDMWQLEAIGQRNVMNLPVLPKRDVQAHTKHYMFKLYVWYLNE